MTFQCKDPNNHCNHSNIDYHRQGKCWKLHVDFNSKNKKKDTKKKNLIAIDSNNQVEIKQDVDENISCTSVKKKVNLSILQHQEENENSNIDAFFNL